MMNAEGSRQQAASGNAQPATGNGPDAFRPSPLAARPGCRAFTMIEIAISLAVIGFALVAIIGVLPIGMNTQKANREETIINQDATVWMNAIRNGARGLDDLTNYVWAITNYVTEYDPTMTRVIRQWRNSYTTTNSSTVPPFPLTNGFRIVGLLSTPKYLPVLGRGGVLAGYLSNNVVAYVRSMSGAASEKFPQDNPDVKDFAFCYRMTSAVTPYWTNYYDPSWVDYGQPGLSASEIVARSNSWRVIVTLQTNLHDLRLLFRWPLRSRGQLGLGSQSYRTLVGGQLLETNDISHRVYFFDPRTYVTNAP